MLRLCEGCGYAQDTQHFSGYGGKTPDVLIVMDYPGGPRKLEMLETLTKIAQLTKEDYAYTYLIRCQPKDFDPETNKICGPLNFDNWMINQCIDGKFPKVIVAMGVEPCKFFLNADTVPQGRSKNQTYKLKLESKLTNDTMEFSIPVVATYSPAQVCADPSFLEPTATDIDRAHTMTIKSDVSKLTHRVFVTTQRLLDELCYYARTKGRITFDVETTGLEWWNVEQYLRLLSISFQAGSGWAIPWVKDQEKLGISLDLQPVYDLFSDPDIEKIAHNAKFDCHWLIRYGVEFKGIVHDTISMHHHYCNTAEHGLKKIVPDMFPLLAGYDSEIRDKDWETVDIEALWTYGATDADMTYRLFIAMENELLQDIPSYTSYMEIFCPSMKALLQSEHDGAWIDKNVLHQAIVKAIGLTEKLEQDMLGVPELVRYEEEHRKELVEKKVAEIKAKIEASTKPKQVETWNTKLVAARNGEGIEYKINLNSPIQLKDFLYTKKGLNLPLPLDQWGKAVASTDKDFLSEIDHPFIETLLMHRQVSKTQSTYLQGILDRVDSNSMLHGSFNQSGTKTFRLSASSPNLQNIISRTKFAEVEEIVAAVKRSFVVPEGWILLQTDFSQAELRVMAHFANETNMIQAYNDGKDLHEIMAADSMHLTLEQFHELDKAVQKKKRQEGKAGNFGFIYGMSAKSFVAYARIGYGVRFTEEEAEALRNSFFRRYPNLLSYHQTYKGLANKQGYVKTLFGTKCYIPDIYAFNKQVKSKAERNAINSPIQGTAGLITEAVIGLLHHRLPEGVRMITTVHDSIIHAMPIEMLKPVAALIKHTAEHVPYHIFGARFDKVVMKVDQEVGTNWKDLKPLE